MRLALDMNHPLTVLLMTPVQRVTRYNLLLSDIAKCFKKAGDEEIYENLRSALEHAHEICEYANNMMIAGRISGFPVCTKYYVILIMYFISFHFFIRKKLEFRYLEFVKACGLW